MPTLQGQVQGAALRRQGRGRALSARRRPDHVAAARRSTGTTSSTSAWARRGRRRKARAHLPAGRREAPRHRGRGHRASAPSASSSAARSRIGKTVGIAGEHLTGARVGRQSPGAREDSALQTTSSRGVPAVRLPRRPTTSATCSSTSATSARVLCRAARWPRRRRCIRGCSTSTPGCCRRVRGSRYRPDHDREARLEWSDVPLFTARPWPHPQIRPFLWYATEAEEAARFYTSLFPDSRIVNLTSLPSESPSGPPGSVRVWRSSWPTVHRDERGERYGDPRSLRFPR